jgi:deoxycytidine triphosphate deaminase
VSVIKGAQTENEALELYNETKERDPYPRVPPALLNSAHIEDYMLATAMVFPYEPKRRKSASYAMRVGNRMAFYDPKNPQQTPYHSLKERQTFELPPNSLVFVQTKELFQLPNYMAVRFNLHIELVHKGLLLGTGPLVDPGFSGRLLIPLHNMTASTYVLAEDDELIWVEFTKTSSHPDWLPASQARNMPGKPIATYADFPKPKTKMRIEDYFERARRPHESKDGFEEYPFPANAIPNGVAEAQRLAEHSKNEAKAARKAAASLQKYGFIGILVAIVTTALPLAALLYSSWQMVQTTVQIADGSNGKVQALTNQLSEMRTAIAANDKLQAELIEREYCLDLAIKAQPERLAVKMLRVVAARQAANRSAAGMGLQSPFPVPATASSLAVQCTLRK